MRSIAAWLAVTGFFVGLNALGAALLYAVFTIGKIFAPALMEEPLVVAVLGLLAIAATVWIAFLCMRALTAMQRRGRARARA